MKLSAPLTYGLIACILLVSAPHAEHLPLWVSALGAALLSWRTYLVYSGNPIPARWLLLMLTLSAAAMIAISFHTLFGRDPGVALLILLAALKLLELKAARDATVLVYLSCFIIITNFFYSQSIPTALFMLVSLLVIMATWIHLFTGDLAFKPRLRLGGILLLQAIPLSLVLFVLFPRVQGPLWGMPQDAYATSGLSDTMSPGSMSRLSLSDAVAFRVTFKDTVPRRDQLYWRGPVLWDYDGTTWTRGRFDTLHQPKLTETGNPVDYSVTLEPHNKPWLFALDMPSKLSIPAFQTPDFQLLSKGAVNSRIRYDASSQLSYQAALEESPRLIQRALELPRGFNPETRQLAAQWRAQNPDPAALVNTALAHFSKNEFFYTLEPPLLGAHSVDDFLFKTRQGFCEHYASSFVFLMRAAGVPARVVTGYQGGELNDFGGYYILRQSDAHAWVEVWLAGRGWVRVDPTGVISPERIESGLRSALPDSDSLPFLIRTQSPILLKLRFNIDALTNQWNQWVLGYNSERQFDFLTRMGMEDVSWKNMALNMLAGIALLTGIFTLILLRRLLPKQADAAQAAWQKLCRKLEKAGLPRAPHEGALDYATRVATARPELGQDLQKLAASYVALRYEGRGGMEELVAFKNAVRSFKL